MVFLVGAALFFPSDLCAHTSEYFHFRKEDTAGASRQTSEFWNAEVFLMSKSCD